MEKRDRITSGVIVFTDGTSKTYRANHTRCELHEILSFIGSTIFSQVIDAKKTMDDIDKIVLNIDFFNTEDELYNHKQ